MSTFQIVIISQMGDCCDPLVVVSPESSNHLMIGSVTPRIVKITDTPTPGPGKPYNIAEHMRIFGKNKMNVLCFFLFSECK